MLVDGKREGKATAERERERRTGGVMWKMATYWSGARGGREGEKGEEARPDVLFG